MIQSAFDTLCRSVRARPPLAAVILGSGLNQVVDHLPCIAWAPFDQLPEMSATCVAGHRGRLGLIDFTCGAVLVYQGRVHFYEGHPWEVVERPVRLAAELGIRTLLLTNASGGIGPSQQAGTLMAICDHIAALRPNWWRPSHSDAANSKKFAPYSSHLLALLRQSALKSGVELTEGKFAGVTGPNYETPAEIRALAALGADAVGMSTVHEATMASSLGMEVAAISCVANRAAGLSGNPLSHAEVLRVMQSAGERLSILLRAFAAQLAAA